METYHKIQTLFKRHQDGPKKGKMIKGAWTTPELEYLAGNIWDYTEKVDGTNIRVAYGLDAKGQPMRSFGGRTDNAVIPQPLLASLSALLPTVEIGNAFLDFKPGDSVILFGEGYGPKIQGGGKYREDHSFVLFDVKIGDFWLLRKDVDDIATKLGIDSVPTIGSGTLDDAIDIVASGISFEKSGAVKRWGRGTLESRWGTFDAEGIVARPQVPMFDRQGQRIITKIKAVDFR
jgi:hypothetical protein